MAGDLDIPPIREEVTRVKGRMEGTRHVQPDLVEGDPLLSASLWGEGAIKRLPYNIVVSSRTHLS